VERAAAEGAVERAPTLPISLPTIGRSGSSNSTTDDRGESNYSTTNATAGPINASRASGIALVAEPVAPAASVAAESAAAAARFVSRRRSGCGAIMKSCTANERTLRPDVAPAAAGHPSYTSANASPGTLPPSPQLAGGRPPPPRQLPRPAPRYATSADIVQEARRESGG